VFRWLTCRITPERLCGHTAGEWYGFYRRPQNFKGDLASAVTAALREAVATRAELPDFAVEPWLTTLLTTDPRETVRCLVAIKLGLDKLAEGEPALLAALHDESEIVRRSAALALVALDTVRGLSAVVAGSRHGHAVRTQAAHGLREHGEEATEAIPGLLCLLRDPNINWRSHAAAAGALAAIGESAIPGLVQVFEHGEPRLRCFVAMALKELNKTPALLAAIDEELAGRENAE
jgi:HEAT repeat protein